MANEEVLQIAIERLRRNLDEAFEWCRIARKARTNSVELWKVFDSLSEAEKALQKYKEENK